MDKQNRTDQNRTDQRGREGKGRDEREKKNGRLNIFSYSSHYLLFCLV